MPPPTTRTSVAAGYRVCHGPRTGSPTSWAAFGAWRDLSAFVAGSVHEAVAPDCTRARVAFNFAAAGVDVWRWGEYFAPDDAILIDSLHPEPADRHVPFIGWIADVEWQFGAADESCAVTAVGPAFRLRRDTIVFGRVMRPATGSARVFTGPPCEFNAGGRPNRDPDLLAGIRPGVRDPLGADGWPRLGVPVFTYDSDPAAVYWTIGDVVDYLQWFYNASETWIRNADLAQADYARTGPIVVSVEGMDLWTALAAAGDRAGYDVGEWIENDGAGEAAASIVVVRRHAGAARIVRHQAPTAAGQFPKLDLELTNLFTADIAESTTSCVAAPVVHGGAALVEITVPLARAWDPAALVVPAGSRIVTPVDGATPEAAMVEAYCRRYVVGGDQFAAYADCGRLFDANTDGAYSAAPYSAAVPDVAALADETAGSWPQMPYRALPCLSYLGVGAAAKAIESFVEISWDFGATWSALPCAYEVAPNRLAVWIGADNLAGIVRPSAGAADTPDPVAENLFYKLVNGASTEVRLRLTCTIAAPDRNGIVATRRPAAGTAFSAAGFFDRAAVGQSRTRAAGSALAALSADETVAADVLADLTGAASEIQDAAEDRLIEANLPIEWPDEDIRLTDVIERIGGIEYDLRVNSGQRVLSPRVVGRTLLLTPDTHSMALQLETARGAGLI